MEGPRSFSNQFAVAYTIVMGAAVFCKPGQENDDEELCVKLEVCDKLECATVFSYDADFAAIAERDRRVRQLEEESRELPKWRRIDIPVGAFRGATLYYKNTINMPTGTKLVFADPAVRDTLLPIIACNGITLEKQERLRTMHAISAEIFKLMVQLATIAEDEKFGHTFLESITCSMNRNDEKLDIQYRQRKSLADGKPVKKN